MTQLTSSAQQDTLRSWSREPKSATYGVVISLQLDAGPSVHVAYPHRLVVEQCAKVWFCNNTKHSCRLSFRQGAPFQSTDASEPATEITVSANSVDGPYQVIANSSPGRLLFSYHISPEIESGQKGSGKGLSIESEIVSDGVDPEIIIDRPS